MFPKFRIAICLVFLFLLIFAIPVFAGGWAVISLDELPMDVVAGEPLTVGFTVLQHGKTPMDGLEPTITAVLSKDEQFKVIVKPYGAPGHYAVDLTFPKEGEWNWSIQAFSMNQKMPTLSVSAPVVKSVSQPAAENEPATVPSSPLLIVRLSALGVGVAALAFAFRRRSRLAATLTVICLLVGVGSLMAAPAVPAMEAQSKSSSDVKVESFISQVEMGRRLFIAKGCITCHVNNKVAKTSDFVFIDVGAPDLTNFSAGPEALRLRLKDPASVKADTSMPNLTLSDAEIEALIAFINSN